MSQPITSFSGPHRFLSNFYPSDVVLDDHEYATVEHAYQAAKTTSPQERDRVRRARTAGSAKHLGRRVTMRPDWDAVKLEVMKRLLRQKFRPGSTLAARLVATGGSELVEGNYWGDTYWGQCPVGTGYNHLGRLLMQVRGELQEQEGSR